MSIRRVLLSSLALLLVLPGVSLAQTCPEVTIDNHIGNGSIAIPGFVAGEEGAAVFQAPAAEYPIQILRVGIGWGSVLGGNPQSLEGAVRVYEGTPPAVTQLFDLPGPVLTDGFINEFDISSFNVVVPSGPFTVSLLIANASTTFGSSMVIDGAGCIPGQNYVNAIPGGWQDLCSFGASGNWVVNVVYESLACTPTGETFRRGDANNDGGFDIADPIRILSLLFSGAAPLTCADAGDVNDDGGVDIGDAVSALASIFSGAPPPPDPGPATCGADPTADPLDCTAPCP